VDMRITICIISLWETIEEEHIYSLKPAIAIPKRTPASVRI
jgi:hypothetical protein